MAGSDIVEKIFPACRNFQPRKQDNLAVYLQAVFCVTPEETTYKLLTNKKNVQFSTIRKIQNIAQGTPDLINKKENAMAEIRKVVIPVDFSSNTDKVIKYGVDIARNLGSKVLFFHVVDDFKGYDMMLVHPSFGSMAKDLEQKAEERMSGLVQDHDYLEQGAAGDVVIGNASEEIIKYAQEEQADMIIIGTHGTKGFERVLMGSTADRVLQKAPCPVLVFNPFV